jgi:hypothetical protein
LTKYNNIVKYKREEGMTKFEVVLVTTIMIIGTIYLGVMFVDEFDQLRRFVKRQIMKRKLGRELK